MRLSVPLLAVLLSKLSLEQIKACSIPIETYCPPHSSATSSSPVFTTHYSFTMAEHNYKFNVSMSCGGCSGAVERVLKKLDGELRLESGFLITR